jgi:hypothetical protein
MFDEFIFTLIVVAIFAVPLVLRLRRVSRDEGTLVIIGFAAHFAAVFAQVFIIREVYGGGDIDAYYRSGVEVANALRADFTMIAPELVKVFFHVEDYQLPFEILGGATPTGSQTVIAAWLFFGLGDSLYAASMAVSLFAFFGKLALYDGLAEGITDLAIRRRILIAATLIPSVIFWCATIAKEAIIIAFLGFMVQVFRTRIRSLKDLNWILLCVLLLAPVAMIKPYVIVALFAAGAVGVYWGRGGEKRFATIRPAALVGAVIVGLIGVSVIGRIAPQFSVDRIGQSTAHIQAAGAHVEGGSNYQLSDATEEDTSLSRQLVLAPLALPTALFRPLLIEVRNPMMLLNSLETTFLLVLVGRLLLRGRLDWVREKVMGNAMLMFCLVFTVLLGTAVGLASTNMGSLSRYRLPFMPCFVTLVLVLDSWLHNVRRQPARPTLGAPAPLAVRR